MSRIGSFSGEIIAAVECGKINNKEELGKWKVGLAKKYSLSAIPSNPTILSFASERNDKLVKILGLKPTRTLSGIAVVALMTAPHKCPGKCIYCPNSLLKGIDVPKSYTGREPAAMRAVKANFDPKRQIDCRLQQLEETGHSTEKVDLIIMGGTFLSQPKNFQRNFMLSSINAITGSNARTLANAKQQAMFSRRRITGITFETRPDFCGRREISSMLSFGGTRCELGVQTVYDDIYRRINRGHTVKDVARATQLLKDSAFKVTYHMMPGLPGSNIESDENALREIFSNQGFKPDSIKLYPCLVMPGTDLFKQWKQGSFKPMDEKQAVELVLKLKRFVPRWVRIMRIQRDIPSNLVAAGARKTNLRQIALAEAEKRGIKCNCIRCREAGLQSRKPDAREKTSKAKEFVETYEASKGTEKFISIEDSERENLFGFLRLRIPYKPFRKEIREGTTLVRDLRVFGKALPLGKRGIGEIQHQGLGKRLMQRAEEISAEEFDAKKLLVISALGTKQYYCSLGFKIDGNYVSKSLN